MTNQITAKSRKELKNKMVVVFGEDVKRLSTDLQDVFLDDLVTALESRLKILDKTHNDTQFITSITERAEYETIET